MCYIVQLIRNDHRFNRFKSKLSLLLHRVSCLLVNNCSMTLLELQYCLTKDVMSALKKPKSSGTQYTNPPLVRCVKKSFWVIPQYFGQNCLLKCIVEGLKDCEKAKILKCTPLFLHKLT